MPWSKLANDPAVTSAKLAAGVVPRRLAYITRDTLYSATSSTVAGAANIFASDLSITANGSTAYRFEIYFPSVYAEAVGNGNTSVTLVKGDGTTIGYPGVGGRTTSGNVGQYYFYSCFSYVPAAGVQTFNVRATHLNANGGTGYPQYTANTSILMHFAIYEPFPV